MRIKMYNFGKSDLGHVYFDGVIIPDLATLEQELELIVDPDLLDLMDIGGLLNKVREESYFTYELHGADDIFPPQYVVLLREDSPYFSVDCFTETREVLNDDYNLRHKNIRNKYFVSTFTNVFTSDPSKVEVVRHDDD
jgi:hypothetical protein